MYTCYPLKNILTYNGTTVHHYTLGAAGIMPGYHAWPVYHLPGALYRMLALSEMYIHMPLNVCLNNLYMAGLVIPIIAVIPALVIGLFVFRFFVIFPRIACVHCRAKKIYPQAQSMFKE